MERESFENDEIAEVLNRAFVPVKVDREERPDVDHIYMTYVQAATGSGGWPMSVFLTPDRTPFFGGTYFAPDNRYGRPGFGTILERIAATWQEKHDEIVQSSGELIAQLKSISSPAASERSTPDRATLDSTFQYFRRTFDSKHGGFGEAQKFPRPAAWNFLFATHAFTPGPEALELRPETRLAMATGGMPGQLA